MSKTPFARPAAPPAPDARPAGLALARWAGISLLAATGLAALFTYVAAIPPAAEPPPEKDTAGQTAGFDPAGGGAPVMGGASSGAAAPAFRLPSLEGKTTSLADFKGQVVVLDFWATWCGPCRQQAEILDDMHRSLGQKVVFLGINVGEGKDVVERYVKRSPFPYATLLDPSQQTAAKYQAQGLPTLVVIGPRGDIVFHQVGVTSAARLGQAIQQAASG